MSDTTTGGSGSDTGGGAVHRGTDTAIGDNKVVLEKGPKADPEHPKPAGKSS